MSRCPAFAARIAGVAGVFLALGAGLFGTVLPGQAGRVEWIRSAIGLIPLAVAARSAARREPA